MYYVCMIMICSWNRMEEDIGSSSMTSGSLYKLLKHVGYFSWLLSLVEFTHL